MEDEMNWTGSMRRVYGKFLEHISWKNWNKEAVPEVLA
jgi:hypothetical protein